LAKYRWLRFGSQTRVASGLPTPRRPTRGAPAKRSAAGRDYINKSSVNAGNLAQGEERSVRLTLAECQNAQVVRGQSAKTLKLGATTTTGITRRRSRRTKSRQSAIWFSAIRRTWPAIVASSTLWASSYLTKVADRVDTKAIEIGWMWYAPPETIKWAASGKQLSVLTDRYKKPWTVALNDSGIAGKYAAFHPAKQQARCGKL
jgi:hypothetical protein